jgi:hypothetical protein
MSVHGFGQPHILTRILSGLLVGEPLADGSVEIGLAGPGVIEDADQRARQMDLDLDPSNGYWSGQARLARRRAAKVLASDSL